ncbi:MAG: hypothetical protein ACXW1W_14965 [Methylococcaceae bacterium]
MTEKITASEATYGLINSCKGTSFSSWVVSQGPPNQKVGIAKSSAVNVRIKEALLSEVITAVFSNKRNTIPLIMPIRNPRANPTNMPTPSYFNID